MNSIKNIALVGMLAVSAANFTPALADHDHHGNGYGNGYGNGNAYGRGWDNDHHDRDYRGRDWDRRDINVRVNDTNYDKHWRKRNNWANDWNGQRTIYRNNWNRISAERQRELDAQMRAQWLAYHHNNWNGNYNWNTYNDPQFLDYLHTSNPGLLGTLRNYLGF